MIKFITFTFSLLFSLQSLAESSQVFTAVSPANRVALLELYTSEGCSSCPPADRFMSRVKLADISDQQLIPLSFHVTYWDHIGWKDRFSNPQHDDSSTQAGEDEQQQCGLYTAVHHERQGFQASRFF